MVIFESVSATQNKHISLVFSGYLPVNIVFIPIICVRSMFGIKHIQRYHLETHEIFQFVLNSFFHRKGKKSQDKKWAISVFSVEIFEKLCLLSISKAKWPHSIIISLYESIYHFASRSSINEKEHFHNLYPKYTIGEILTNPTAVKQTVIKPFYHSAKTFTIRPIHRKIWKTISNWINQRFFLNDWFSKVFLFFPGCVVAVVVRKKFLIRDLRFIFKCWQWKPITFPHSILPSKIHLYA